jgi:hypothetical protein
MICFDACPLGEEMATDLREKHEDFDIQADCL